LPQLGHSIELKAEYRRLPTRPLEMLVARLDPRWRVCPLLRVQGEQEEEQAATEESVLDQVVHPLQPADALGVHPRGCVDPGEQERTDEVHEEGNADSG